MTLDRNIIRRVLEKLNRAEIGFMIHSRGTGSYSLDSDDVLEYLDNPMACLARWNGVSEEGMKKWIQYMDGDMDFSCETRTSKNERCGGYCRRPDGPKEFEAMGKTICNFHRKLAEKNDRQRRKGTGLHPINC